MSSYAGVKEAKEAYKNHNYEAAFKEFLILANAGDANAQFIVAYMYSIGEGVPSNIQQAVKWYVNAANNGDVDAQLALGKMYYSGGLVAKDKKEAFFGTTKLQIKEAYMLNLKSVICIAMVKA